MHNIPHSLTECTLQMLDNLAAQMTLMHQVLRGEEEGAEVKGVPGVKGVAEMVSQTSLLLQTHPTTSL